MMTPVIAADSVGSVRAVIDAIIAAYGSVIDRRGRPGVDQARIEKFFSDARAVLGWHLGSSGKKPGTALDTVGVDKLRTYVAHESTVIIALWRERDFCGAH